MNLHLPFTRGVEKREPVIVITPLGQQKAEKFEGQGIEFRALAILHDEGPTSIKDLANRLNIESDKARAIANKLIQNGWATRAS